MVKKAVAVVLTAAMALTVGTSAFAAEDETEKKDFYITEATTLSDIVEYTNPEEYAQMPAEIKERLETAYVKDYKSAENNSTSDEQARAILLNGHINKYVGNINAHGFYYNTGISMNMVCPYIYFETIIYEHNTGKLITSSYDADYNTDSVSTSETVTDLEPTTWYDMVMFGDVIPPEGYITLVDDLKDTDYIHTSK